MDGRITGGSASFMKRLNKGNYEHEEATVKLDFAMNEDAADHTGVLGRATAEAKVAVLVQLGLAPAPAVAPAVVAPKAPSHRKSATIEKLDEHGDPLAPAASPPVTSATVAAASGGSVTDDPLAPASVGSSVDASPAASVASGGDDPLAPAAGASNTAASANAGSDPAASGADPFTARREVTDVDLGTAAARKNEALIKAHGPDGTLKIRDVVGQYCAPGQPMRTIPQNMRAEFLAKLEALS